MPFNALKNLFISFSWLSQNHFYIFNYKQCNFQVVVIPSQYVIYIIIEVDYELQISYHGLSKERLLAVVHRYSMYPTVTAAEVPNLSKRSCLLLIDPILSADIVQKHVEVVTEYKLEYEPDHNPSVVVSSIKGKKLAVIKSRREYIWS